MLRMIEVIEVTGSNPVLTAKIKAMKYVIYYFFYCMFQLKYFIWHLRFDKYTFKQYFKDVEYFEFPIDPY